MLDDLLRHATDVEELLLELGRGADDDGVAQVHGVTGTQQRVNAETATVNAAGGVRWINMGHIKGDEQKYVRYYTIPDTMLWKEITKTLLTTSQRTTPLKKVIPF